MTKKLMPIRDIRCTNYLLLQASLLGIRTSTEIKSTAPSGDNHTVTLTGSKSKIGILLARLTGFREGLEIATPPKKTKSVY